MRRLLMMVLLLVFCGGLYRCQYQSQNSTDDSIEILSEMDSTKFVVVELPRPNSGDFSYEEAEKRKDDIYEMQLSAKYFDWENPTSGGALHINKNDEIEVYQFTMGLMFLKNSVDEKGDSVAIFSKAPIDTSYVISKRAIKDHVAGVGYGKAASVLITSEYNLKESKSLDLIMGEVLEPGTQIYYLKKK